MMNNLGGGNIGQQIKGEMGELLKDVGKAVADIPRQMVEGPAKTPSGQVDEGKLLEQGQQIGDDSQVKKVMQQSRTSQGVSPGQLSDQQRDAQQRLKIIRRNLDQEVQGVRKRKEQEEEQQKQAEERQKEQVKQMKAEQKKEAARKPSKVQQMLGLGKGERIVSKGK